VNLQCIITHLAFLLLQRCLTPHELIVQDIVLGSILLRPFPCRVVMGPITYTKEKHGQVPAVYIKYLQDTTLLPVAQDYIVKHFGPFKEVVEIDGGHFNFWPKVDDFAKLVTRLADKYNVVGEEST
jgi:hypothetical protein